MYGAVHHQGDVYDSTPACVPSLFALLAEEEVAERGAECLAALDGAAAAPLRDLAEAEPATRRRYTARTDVHGSHDVLGDEELLRVCRAVATR
jgi:hypothetical protein